jgi:TolA-binding protein
MGNLMQQFALNLVVFLMGAGALWSASFFDNFLNQSKQAGAYEVKSLKLARENRELKLKYNKLSFDMQQLESKNNFISIKLDKKSREIASLKTDQEDLVQWEVYRWSPDKLLAIGDKEFHYKKFEKAAQFYNEFVKRYPSDENMSDRVLFAAGIAAFESKTHFDWSIVHLGKLVRDYPKSKYFRGAKLWLALSHLQNGNEKTFYATVEEFRKKYRNTKEWSILSKHYETITRNYSH